MRRATFLIFFLMLTQLPLEAKEISKSNRPYGGTLVWGTCHKPTIINPILTSMSVSAALEELIFNKLVRINSKGEIEPDLAESWDIQDGGLIYTFYLKKGVKFHDGVECTAWDVKFTYDNIVNPQNNSPFRPSFELVNDFKVIDKYTFQIILKKPATSFIYRLIREIAPRHILGKEDLANCSFNFHPVGTGPFKFEEWTGDNQIILEYNPDYYEGRPYLDKIIVKTYPDSTALWTALMRGEIDFMLFIEKEDYQVVKDDPAFKGYAIPADYYYALAYNLDDPLLADKRVREAIAYGVDRKSLIERVAGGYGLECRGPFHPECFGFNPQVKPFDYHPEKSQALLAQAGWQDKDKDGILEKNGEELEIKVLVDERRDIFKRITMVLRQQLQEIGIKVRVILYDNEDVLTNEEFLKQNKPQAHLKLFIAGIDYIQIEEEWGFNFIRPGKLWHYRNEEVNKLFESGKLTDDLEERKEVFHKIHQLVYADQPVCFLYFPHVFHALSKKFNNVDEFFTLCMPFYTLKDWYFSPTDEHRYYKDTKTQVKASIRANP
jgi:peptide/nickel transport system substrate-binding protein